MLNRTGPAYRNARNTIFTNRIKPANGTMPFVSAQIGPKRNAGHEKPFFTYSISVVALSPRTNVECLPDGSGARASIDACSTDSALRA